MSCLRYGTVWRVRTQGSTWTLHVPNLSTLSLEGLGFRVQGLGTRGVAHQSRSRELRPPFPQYSVVSCPCATGYKSRKLMGFLGRSWAWRMTSFQHSGEQKGRREREIRPQLQLGLLPLEAGNSSGVVGRTPSTSSVRSMPPCPFTLHPSPYTPHPTF